MRRLSAKDIVGVWEHYDSQAPIRRALAIIRAACPEMTPEEIAHCTIGERDLLLLNVRRRTIGPRIDALAECPACGEPAEFTLEAGDITVGALGVTRREHDLGIDDYELRYRLLDSTDLAAAAHCASLEEARACLVERAIMSARRGGAHVHVADLPERIVHGVADAIAEHDPQADIVLDLACSACDHAWQVLFDIASFLWEELRAAAFGLLRDVYQIAGTCGWSEEAILEMSDVKRKLYLEM